MKEIKVYVDELPENCKKCVYSHINLAFGVETRICNLQYGFISANDDKFPNCPLQSLKTHDRELVKEVCEKIRDMAHKVGKLVFCEYCYAINPARAIDEHLLNEILGQIESEFEQKEFEK